MSDTVPTVSALVTLPSFTLQSFDTAAQAQVTPPSAFVPCSFGSGRSLSWLLRYLSRIVLHTAFSQVWVSICFQYLLSSSLANHVLYAVRSSSAGSNQLTRTTTLQSTSTLSMLAQWLSMKQPASWTETKQLPTPMPEIWQLPLPLSSQLTHMAMLQPVASAMGLLQTLLVCYKLDLSHA